jgi:glutaredoxin 3
MMIILLIVICSLIGVIAAALGTLIRRRLIAAELERACDPRSLAAIKKNSLAETKKVGIFSAGCAMRKETIEMVRRLSGLHEVVIYDMHEPEVVSRAKQLGVRSVPAVVIDGKLAGCCAGQGPDEQALRSAL